MPYYCVKARCFEMDVENNGIMPDLFNCARKQGWVPPPQKRSCVLLVPQQGWEPGLQRLLEELEQSKGYERAIAAST